MFRDFIDAGGPLMWPLLGCSVLLVAILFERAVSVGVRHRLLGRRMNESRRTWHRRALPFFTDVPPSLGLLGTVVGVVQSFQVIDGRLSTDAVGAGLGVACMTTIYGLGIAIIASVSGYLLDWAAAPAAEAKP